MIAKEEKKIWTRMNINSGACAYIEREAFGRAVMWWPCFHHILELVLGALIQKRWPTEGPRDGVYTRFKKEWPGILKKIDEFLSSAGEKVKIDKKYHFLIKKGIKEMMPRLVTIDLSIIRLVLTEFHVVQMLILSPLSLFF